MIEVRSAGPAGLGVFALKLIPRGTRIFSERALITLARNRTRAFYPNVKRLSKKDRDGLMRLTSFRSREMDFWRWGVAISDSVANAFGRMLGKSEGGAGRKSQSGREAVLKAEDKDDGARNSMSDHVAAMSIFRSNSFNIGHEFGVALFPRTARINHSCLPNAQGNYNPDLQSFTVHATRDIEGGEEVRLNYLSEVGQLRSKRIEELSSRYGFECTCPACDLGGVKAREGEEKRIELGKILKAFVENGTGGVEMEMATYMAYIEFFESEGISGRELSHMYSQAADLSVAMKTLKRALKLSETSLQLDKDCLGTDHPMYKKGLEDILILRQTESEGQRPEV